MSEASRTPPDPTERTEPLRTVAPSDGSPTVGDATQPAGQSAVPLAPTIDLRLRLPPTGAAGSGPPAFGVPSYEILGELGRGGMGVVYKARHIPLNRLVAIKVIRRGDLAGPEEVARFRRETEAVACLQHPNIVQIYEVGEQAGLPYCALEYVDGGSLEKKLAGAPLPARQAADLVARLAEAVHAAHERGIIHRDLKPANVLLTQDGTPKITDFGLAKRLGSDGSQTQSGMVMGTPSYMAPEQAAGQAHTVTAAADVYALGAVLYETLTGRPPFPHGGMTDTLQRVLAEDPLPPTRFVARLPRDLETICLKCLQKEPYRRYPTALGLAEDLRRFLAGEPIRARSVSAGEKLWIWMRRRPATAALVILSGIAALALVGLGVAASYTRALGESYHRLQEQEQKTQAALAERETYLYFNRIVLAEREWQGCNLARVNELLAECPQERRGWEWHYLNRLCHGDRFTFRGHHDEVLTVAYSPDGSRIASAGIDPTVQVWEPATGRVCFTLSGPAGWVRSMVYSPDSRWLAACSGTAGAFAATPSPTEIKIWDARTGQEVQTLRDEPGVLDRLAFAPDSRRLAAAGGNRRVTVWDVESGQKAFTLPAPTGAGSAVTFSRDGRWLATGGNRDPDQCAVRLWDAKTGQLRRALTGHTDDISDLDFRSDGRLLAAAGGDSTITVWDLQLGTTGRTLRGHEHIVDCVRFHPDGRYLASCGEDGTIRIWYPASGEQLRTLRGHRGGGVNRLAFRPDGRQLASAGDDRTVRLWDPNAEQEAITLAGHSGTVRAIAFHPEGRLLASGSNDQTVKLWDLGTGQAVRTLRGHSRRVHSVAFSPDGRLLASGSFRSGMASGGELRLWNVASGKLIHDLAGHGGAVMCIAFSADGRRMATGSLDKTVRLWDPAAGKLVYTLQGHTGPVAGLAFSPDGTQLVTTSHDLTTRFWDVASGQCRHTVTGQTHFSYSVAFSPDGRRVALASGDTTVKLLDAETAAEVLVLRRHRHNVVAVAFSPDGKRIGSASEDNTIKLWDAATGQEILTLRGIAGWEAYNALAFSPDSRRIAAPGKDGTIKIWDATPLPEAEAP
jgi:WD40 repeat protein